MLVEDERSLALDLRRHLIYLGLDDFSKFNAVYATYFPENPLARATVELARLPRDVLVEIAVIAGQ
jgi:2-iminobutanoate/2-iminopropanoate deaminase